MADCVHAPMDSMEPSLLGPILRPPLSYADTAQLLEARNPILGVGKLGESPIPASLLSSVVPFRRHARVKNRASETLPSNPFRGSLSATRVDLEPRKGWMA
jgi:hypothetical protein